MVFAGKSELNPNLFLTLSKENLLGMKTNLFLALMLLFFSTLNTL